MSTFSVFTTTGTFILAPFSSMALSAAAITSALKPIIIAGLTINIMWHGYETIRGKGGQNAFLDVFAMSLRVGLVWALGLVAYTTNVPPLINEFIAWLSGLFGASGATNTSFNSGANLPALNALDASCQKALTSFEKIWDIATGTGSESGNPSHIQFNVTTASDYSGIMMILQGGLMFLAFGIYAVIAAFELLYIQIALLVFYIIGPVFIAAFAFKATERFFDAWLAGVMKYAMTSVVIAICIGLGNSILSTYTTSISGNLTTMAFIQLGVASLLAAIMLVLLILRIPQLAGDIVGGIGIATAASTVRQAANAVKDSKIGSQGSAPPALPTPSTPKAQNAILSGISKGMGNAAEGIGSGVGHAAQGAGLAVHAMGKSIQAYTSKSGTGSITGSNARPMGQGIQEMLKKDPSP
jgi:type IV secretion system protein VirB6